MDCIEFASRLFHPADEPLMTESQGRTATHVVSGRRRVVRATLLLRPLGVETLATLLYAEAPRGTYEDGAIAALLIVSVGLTPVWVSSRVTDYRP